MIQEEPSEQEEDEVNTVERNLDHAYKKAKATLEAQVIQVLINCLRTHHELGQEHDTEVSTSKTTGGSGKH